MSTVISGDTGCSQVMPGSIQQDDLANGVVGKGPVFSAYADASQSITSGVPVKVHLGTRPFDPTNCYDTVNDKFQPTIAGYYQINATLRIVGTTITAAYLAFYKNGVVQSRGMEITTAPVLQLHHSDLIYLNGTTDYVELYGRVDATSPSFSFSSIALTSRMSAFLARAA